MPALNRGSGTNTDEEFTSISISNVRWHLNVTFPHNTNNRELDFLTPLAGFARALDLVHSRHCLDFPGRNITTVVSRTFGRSKLSGRNLAQEQLVQLRV